MISNVLSELLSFLPVAVAREILQISDNYRDFEKRLSEIRIRADRICTLTLDMRPVTMRVFVSAQELHDCVKAFCKGSVYAYSESLAEGFITTDSGFRVGVAGRALRDEKRIYGVTDIKSISIRIPHSVAGAGDAIVSAWREERGGILVYSPPGVGKTTALRDAAIQLSSGKSPLRVVIVDSRGEFPASLIDKNCTVDVLTGYPKAVGIETATRTLSPDVIICDEIGNTEEAIAILGAQSTGVSLIASAHAASLSELLSRRAVKILSLNGVFRAYIGVSRIDGVYAYTTDRHISIGGNLCSSNL